MTLLERVARAIAAQDWNAPISESERVALLDAIWSAHSLRDKYMAKARAAVEAMREPTEAMRDAGYAAACEHDYGDLPPSYEIAPVTFRAMIDAALSDPLTPAHPNKP